MNFAGTLGFIAVIASLVLSAKGDREQATTAGILANVWFAASWLQRKREGKE